MRNLILLLMIVMLSNVASSKDWPKHTIAEVSNFLKKNESCYFAWEKVGIPPKTPEQKRFEIMSGGYSGFVVQSVDSYRKNFRDTEYYNYRTNVYCIYDGTLGSGMNVKTGCFAGRYDIDNDTVSAFAQTTDGRKAIPFIEQKCTAQVAKDLLLTFSIKNPLYSTTYSGAWSASLDISPVDSSASEYKILYDKWGIGNEIVKSYEESVRRKANSEILEEQNAKRGDAASQLKLGRKYLDNGDTKNGTIWIEKAANQGLAAAQYEFYILLYVASRTKEAQEWLVKSAMQNYGLAQMKLGDYYYFKSLNKEAITWYLKAANQNVPSACKRVGDMIRDGRGFAKDLNKALGWYEKAASLGDRDAIAGLPFLKLEILNSQTTNK